MRASTYPLLDVAEAREIVLRHTPSLPAERVSVRECAGRVLAADLVAPHELPRWRVSAVDGFAIRAADAGRSLHVIGESAAGRPFAQRLQPGTTARILTGGMLPDGADAVVMLEDTEQAGDSVRVPANVSAGVNFHAPGADLQRGEVVARRGTTLRAAEVGLAAALGVSKVDVFRRPTVALMSTGDELVELDREPARGQIYDSNRHALAATLAEAGAEVRQFGIAPDTPAELRELVTGALAACDVLVTSGGVSVGTHDLVKPLLGELGEVLVGRVKLKPGKPFTFATLPGDRIAFGLPGFPVSSLVTFEVFVRPALRKMQGHSTLYRPALPVRLAHDARAPGDRTEYQRVRLERRGEELVATATGPQSSSRLMSLVGAHALVRIPPGADGYPAGTVVEALILELPA